MYISKNILAAKLKLIKGLLNSDYGKDFGVLIRNGFLYATNMEIGVKTILKVNNNDESFLIPKEAVELLENLPEGEIEIIPDEKSIFIKSGKIKNRYSTCPASNFIEMEVPEVNNCAKVKSEEFLAAIQSVMYSIPDESSKEVLKGVYLDAKNGFLNIVGCDGYRMAWAKVKYDGTFNVLVPKSAMKQLLTIGIKGDISFEWDSNRIIFRTEDTEVTSRLLSGNYPKYETMFCSYDNQTIIKRKELGECLKRSMICASDKYRTAICCRLSGEELSVTLKGSVSEYEETVALEVPLQNEIEIGANARFLLEALNSFKSENVSIQVNTPTNPILLDDGELYALVLPVKLKQG